MRGKIIQDLKMHKLAFEEAKIPWVLIDGLVLGYVRGNGIIPWDTDVDLAVCKELTSEERDNLLYVIMPKYEFRIKKQEGDFIYGIGKSTINLWFYHMEGDYYVSYPRSAPLVKFVEKAEPYDNIQQVEFEGGIYPMPGCLENYLIDRYGKNWKTETWSHDDWYKEKRGIGSNASAKIQQDIWVKGRCGKNGDLWPRIVYIEDAI